MMMSKAHIINEIKFLSEELGLTDGEIAERLGYARGSIQRIRKQNGILKYDKNKRVTKACRCKKCGKIFYIGKEEVENLFCYDCY